jgi:hypothetical protein
MKLNTVGISMLRGNKALWELVRKALDVSKNTMYRYVQNNDETLTQAAAMLVIKKETGLTDSEILEEEKATA